MNKKRACLGTGTACFANSRKGQVTVFIIIGILILFTFAAILYVTKTTTEEKITAEGEPVIAEVPQEFKPIQTYTENCLSQVAKRGLVILGQQGGYIYPDLVGQYSSTDPTEAEGLDLEPLAVPYWHYNSEQNPSNKVVYNSLKPALYSKDDPEMSIEAQLARFTKDNLDECLDDYISFQEEGYGITKAAEKSLQVTVGETGVNFLLAMNVEAQKGAASASMEQFFVRVPLNLKHYYEVAELISSEESNKYFLERQGLEVLSAYSAVDPNLFPPQSEVKFEYFAPYSWSEPILKDKFKGLLISYIPMLRYLGSENFYYRLDDERGFFTQKILDNMVLPLLGAEDLQISFDYFGWEPYFKTNSDDDGKITPEHIFVSYMVFSFGQQRYETHYDASYPVLVTLNDEFAFDGEGYQFLFALESNIRNNNPALPNEVRESYPRRLTSLACNEEQKNTQMLKTVVVDSFTGEPLDMVKIGFSIPEQAECDIGVTDEKGVLESRYPSVYGGVVNFIKEDYLVDFYPIDTYKYKDSSAIIGYSAAGAGEGAAESEKVIELYQFKTINITVQKKELQKCITPMKCTKIIVPDYLLPVAQKIKCEEEAPQCFFNEGQNLLAGEPLFRLEANYSLSRYHDYYFINKALDLEDDESAMVVMERIKGFHDEVKSQEFFATFSVEGKEAAEVQLVPGIYKVSIIPTKDKELVIPTDSRCYQYDVLTWETETCFDYNATTLKKYTLGSTNWDTPESYLVITPEDLYTSRGMNFYTLTQDIYSVPEYLENGNPGRVLEDLQVQGKFTDLTKRSDIRSALEPKYVPAAEE